jgi:hypothetical protein
MHWTRICGIGEGEKGIGEDAEWGWAMRFAPFDILRAVNHAIL